MELYLHSPTCLHGVYRNNFTFTFTLQCLSRLPQYILIIILPGSWSHWFAYNIFKSNSPLSPLYTGLGNLTSELSIATFGGSIFSNHSLLWTKIVSTFCEVYGDHNNYYIKLEFKLCSTVFNTCNQSVMKTLLAHQQILWSLPPRKDDPAYMIDNVLCIVYGCYKGDSTLPVQA